MGGKNLFSGEYGKNTKIRKEGGIFLCKPVFKNLYEAPSNQQFGA